MLSEHTGGTAARSSRLLVWMTERDLRKRHLLDHDERLVEWRQGRVERWWAEGRDQPLPPAFSRLDLSPLRGLASCSYSRRQFFLGGAGAVTAGLQSIWHAQSTAGVLTVTLSAPALTTFRWRPRRRGDAHDLSGFASRLRAQRERRLAELLPEERQRVAEHASELMRWGESQAAWSSRAGGPGQTWASGCEQPCWASANCVISCGTR